MYMHAKYEDSITTSSKAIANVKVTMNLTFDTEIWPWHVTSQNVQLHEVDMHDSEAAFLGETTPISIMFIQFLRLGNLIFPFSWLNI